MCIGLIRPPFNLFSHSTVSFFAMGQSSSRIETTHPSQICPVSPETPAAPAMCPIDHQNSAAKPAQCPVDHDSKPARCPVDHASVNPLNQMPDLSQQPQSNQSIDLPLERSESSIPR